MTKISKEKSSASTAASTGLDHNKSVKSVVVIDSGSQYLTKKSITGSTEQVDALTGLKGNTRYILKTDAYITKDIHLPQGVEMLLDGGNLYRYNSVNDVPVKIVCVNGSLIDVQEPAIAPESITGVSKSRIVGVGENSCFKNFGPQTNYTVEYNMMDFVSTDDYVNVHSAKSIDLYAVVDRIFKSMYNDYLLGNQTMVIKVPQTHFGHTSFFLKRTLHIRHNVTIDFAGCKVYIPNGFTFDSSDADMPSVFTFDTNSLYPNLATSVIKNAEIELDYDFVKAHDSAPYAIFNLRNFSGVMENVKFSLGVSLKCIAMWQPYGNSTESYSSRKIIRRCTVSNSVWRTETPTVLFCTGDGCIIEQSILGFVAIIGGKSYVIKGCLNDSYFLYDTTADFSGSYWEVGQFQILDSNVRFAASRIDCQNNHFNIRGNENLRRYLGPWMAIDTDGCRKRLANMPEALNLGKENFNDIHMPDANGISSANLNKYMAHVTSHNSTVSFDPTIRCQHLYWGYRQPMAGQLLKVGEGARIIGIENLESLGITYIHNSLKNKDYESNKEVGIDVYNRAIIPLVNGDFYDLKRNVEVPSVKSITVRKGEEITEKIDKHGCDWINECFSDFEVRFLLDRKRQLYSSSEKFAQSIEINNNENCEIKAQISVNMTDKEYENLMVELTFKRKGKGYYVMRQHCSRIVAADMVSYGTNKLKPNDRGYVTVADFTIAKVPDVFSGLSKGTAKILTEQRVEGCDTIEAPAVTDDIPSLSNNTLSDYCGNMYNPSENSPVYPKFSTTKLQRIGVDNVRAYVSEIIDISDLSNSGEWNDGDQVVVGNILYIRHNDDWHKLSSLA